MTQPSSTEHDNPTETPAKRSGMSTRNRVIFLVTGWLIVLMPFLFWWSTWFGRQLSDQQLTEYLRDDAHPRHIQHALIQMGERMSRHDTSAARWYPELVRLTAHPVEEVRNTDAWVLGQDTGGAGFHEALLKMLNDPSPLVRGNAALSLVRFGDATGRPQIVALLQSAQVNAPSSGRVVDADKAGIAIHQGGLIAKLQNDGQTVEVRSPIAGRIRNMLVQTGDSVAAGREIATIDPNSDQVWEALRALYLIGQPEDLAAITPYERELPEVPDHVRQQAILAEKAIRQRANGPS
jgi:Biotin-requiring enzyme/HEAT repeat